MGLRNYSTRPEDRRDDLDRMRHILVALDASRHSQAALEAAVNLAKSMDAELHGLFVEDINWFNISKLPMLSEVSDLTGTLRPLQSDWVERQVRILAERARQLLQQQATLNQLPYQFETVRGEVAEQVLKASEHADLVTIGRTGQSLEKTKELGHTARAILRKSQKPVLILNEGMHLGQHVMALYDGTAASQNALQMAQNVADRRKSNLVVLVPLGAWKSTHGEPVDPIQPTVEEQQDALGKLRNEIRGQIASDFTNWNIDIISQSSPDAHTLGRIIRMHGGGLFVLDFNPALSSDRRLQQLLDEIPCPLLLTRTKEAKQ